MTRFLPAESQIFQLHAYRPAGERWKYDRNAESQTPNRIMLSLNEAPERDASSVERPGTLCHTVRLDADLDQLRAELEAEFERLAP